MASLRTAGTGATAPGGHPSQMGGPPFPTVTDSADADVFVSARIAEGSDYIKIIYDDLAGLGMSRRPMLDRRTLAPLVAAAHRHGKRRGGHVGLAARTVHPPVVRPADDDPLEAERFLVCRHCRGDSRDDVARSTGARGHRCTGTRPNVRRVGPSRDGAAREGRTHAQPGARRHDLRAGACVRPHGPRTNSAESSRGPVLVEGDPTTDILHTRRIVKVWKRGVEATRLRYEK
jgi:hypothetical protein